MLQKTVFKGRKGHHRKGAYSRNWTVTYTSLNQNVMGLAVAGQTRALSWMSTDANGNRLGITIFEAGEVGGPGFGGCPNGADYAVAASDHDPAVNSHNVGKDLVLSGVSKNASSISVTLDDEDTLTPAVTTDVPAANLSSPGGAQTWSVSLPAASVKGLKDGTLTAKATYALADGTTVSDGVSLKVPKDTIAPEVPKGTPGAGTYSRTQSVTLCTKDLAKTFYAPKRVAVVLNHRSPLWQRSAVSFRPSSVWLVADG